VSNPIALTGKRAGTHTRLQDRKSNSDMNSANQNPAMDTNDNIILAGVVGTPAGSIYVSGGDLKSDGGISVNSRIFGVTPTPTGMDVMTTSGLLHVTNITPPNATATLETSSSIRIQLGLIPTALYFDTPNAIAYDAANSRVLLTGRHLAFPSSRVIAYTITQVNRARDWELFE
jgi:hypothetical protein